nr:unnamed protein product [Digitaria exilis]
MSSVRVMRQWVALALTVSSGEVGSPVSTGLVTWTCPPSVRVMRQWVALALRRVGAEDLEQGGVGLVHDD